MSKSIKNLCKIYLLNFVFVFPGTSKVQITSNPIPPLSFYNKNTTSKYANLAESDEDSADEIEEGAVPLSANLEEEYLQSCNKQDLNGEQQGKVQHAI